MQEMSNRTQQLLLYINIKADPGYNKKSYNLYYVVKTHCILLSVTTIILLSSCETVIF